MKTLIVLVVGVLIGWYGAFEYTSKSIDFNDARSTRPALDSIYLQTTSQPTPDLRGTSVKDWRWSHDGKHLTIEGTLYSFMNGQRLQAAAYDMEGNFLGSGFTFLSGKTFNLNILNVSKVDKVKVEFTFIN